MPDTLALFAADEAATDLIGASMASQLRQGDLVLLDGDLGAGKTALARAIIRALCGDPALEVPSPTFLLVLPYAAGQITILHADLYRLAGNSEIEELGLFDDETSIILAEWPDRVPDLFARADITVKFEMGHNGLGRSLHLEVPRDPDRSRQLAGALSDFAA